MTAGQGAMARGARIGTGLRSGAVLVIASVAGLLMFIWPLLVRVDPNASNNRTDAPFLFIAILPVVLIVVLAEFAEGGMDSKALAMLGVLSAINAALRPLGAGTAGIELVFFMLVLAGRVFGAGFGFVLGCTSLFASALLTAGVGPWLPFQMMCAAWIGMGAGLLPRRVRGRSEIAMLIGYAIFVSYAYGFLMNLTTWPFLIGIESTVTDANVAFVAGAPMLENLHRFVLYTVFTTSAGWDTGRAITNAIAIGVLGPAVLNTLRRAARRAAYRSPASKDAGIPGVDPAPRC